MRRFVPCLLAASLACATAALSPPARAATEAYAEGLKAYRAGNYPKAYRQLLPLARKKDARAMYLVGVMYQTGRAVPKDDSTAAGWFEAAARLGNASAQYALARLTIEGRGVDKNRDKGVALLKAAAAQGHQESIGLLERIGPAPQRKEATVTAPAASLASVPAATPLVAAARPPAMPASEDQPAPVVFTGFDRSAAEAALAALHSLLRRLAGAEDTDARKALEHRAVEFAKQYWHVEAVDDAALTQAFNRSAREHAGLLVPLARELSGAKAPESQAVGGLLIRLAGSPNPALRTGCPATIEAAQAGFAFAWMQGARCIVERDAQQASDWTRAAAAAGHAGAQELVGRSCIEGEPKNWRCATEWLGRAAAGGRASAMPVLGWALVNQPNASAADQRAALGWYEKAADAGDLFAMNNLAAMLERGPVALRDTTAARRRYAQAARTGFGPAQYNLGRMLAAGEGGSADLAEAADWLGKAAAAGVSEAQAALDQLKRGWSTGVPAHIADPVKFSP